MALRSGSLSSDPLDPATITANLHHASILPLCTGLARRITIFLNDEPESLVLRAVQERTRVALGVLDAALERFSPDELSLSYQGRPEDLVLLNLVLCALAGHRATPLPLALQTIYVAAPGTALAAVDAFVSESVAMYRLDLAPYHDLPADVALGKYLGARPRVRAILAGATRAAGPRGQMLTHFDEAAPVTHVHPIVDWEQDEVSAFIQHFGIPHSSLYPQAKSPGTGEHDLEYGSPIY